VAIVGAFAAFVFDRSGGNPIVALLLPHPPGCTGSHLLATTTPDYRTIYVPTLLIQARCLNTRFVGMAALNRPAAAGVSASAKEKVPHRTSIFHPPERVSHVLPPLRVG
jgi:hypothetical protein